MPVLPPDSQEKKKFAFDNDFFDVTVAGGGNSVAVAPVMAGGTQESPVDKKVRLAREEGYASGLADGRLQATQTAAAELAELKNQLITLTQSLEHAQQSWSAALEKKALGLLRFTLHHLIGHAAGHYPDQLLEHFLHDLLPQLRTTEELHLRLHPQARAYHEKLGLPQASISGRAFQIIPDPTLGPADVVIEWRGGGLETRLTEVLARLDQLFQGTDTTLPVPPAPNANGFAPPRAVGPAPVGAPAPEPDEVATIAAAQKARAEALLADN